MTVKKVGIWIRVSTEDQAKGESPVHHEARARAYAQAKGWEVAALYDLSGVSGKSVIEHPEAKRMLADVASGAISGLIFSKLARLARNTRELLDFADYFGEHEADLISLQESIDTSTPAGRLFYTMIAAMAQWEREEISSRVAASIPIRAKLGKPIGGSVSYGYHWVEGKLVPHPDEAPIRTLIYTLFLEHRRKKTVAKILNEQGYRTRSGAKWTDTTITRLLRDPTAVGRHRANYTRSEGRGRHAVLKPENEWVWRPVEAIVSEEVWSKCQALLDEQLAGKPERRRGAHLFSGRVRCGCNGSPMYVHDHLGKYTCQTCRTKIPGDDLEALFRDQLTSFFFSEDDLAAFFEKEDHDLAAKQAQLGALERELRKVQADTDRAKRGYFDEVMDGRARLSTEEFNGLYKPLFARATEIEDAMPRLQAAIDLAKINRLSADEVIHEARDLYSRWDALAFEEKRAIVEAIVDRIVVSDGEVEIHLHYLPDSANPPPESGGNGGQKATRNHGFIAATSWKRAG